MSEPTRPYKTKNCLSLAERINVINYSEANQHLRIAQLAQIFACSYSQIREILLRKDAIRKDYENNETYCSYFVELQNDLHISIEMKAVKFIIMEWYMRCKFLGIQVDDNKILDMTEHTANILQYNDFQQNIKKDKSKWIHAIRSAESNQEFKAYVMKLNNIPRTSLKIEDIILKIQSVLPVQLQEKLNCFIKTKFPNMQILDENKKILNWNDDVISLGSSDSETEDIDVGHNENYNDNQYKNCDNKNYIHHNKCYTAKDFNSFDGNISVDNNEYITFTDFNEIPDYNCKPYVIQNYQDGLEQVKRLEEFSMRQDDMKAIDLIGNLKLHFQNTILNRK